jgi:hypothetical protein
MEIIHGFLALNKRQRGANDSPEVFVHGMSISAVEPHRTGCYVYAGSQRFDVTHSHTEIMQAVEKVWLIR